ncbi:MAG: ATP synthase F1 subunit delta [Clostridiales bacterium]|jgi:F-type H+-transporting ATPase subunit delta|nr:ATP synthase F1 subunit delta [Clostridiales bacterium]
MAGIKAAGRYAEALFQLAEEKNALELFHGQSRLILDILQQDAEFAALLRHPRIKWLEKEAWIHKAFSGKISKELIGLLVLLLKKGRGGEIYAVLDAFNERARARKGIISARVSSAAALTGDQLAQVRAKLETIFHKEVEIETDVDPSLIGGLKIQASGLLIDGSVKNTLHNFKRKLERIGGRE